MVCEGERVPSSAAASDTHVMPCSANANRMRSIARSPWGGSLSLATPHACQQRTAPDKAEAGAARATLVEVKRRNDDASKMRALPRITWLPVQAGQAAAVQALSYWNA